MVPTGVPSGEGNGTAAPGVRVTVDLPPGTSAQVTVETFDPGGFSTGKRTVTVTDPGETVVYGGSGSRPNGVHRVQAGMGRLASLAHIQAASLDRVLLWGAILLYLITRLVGLESYPIYFFTDEAIQTNLAADFLAKNFLSREGELFPTYFVNGGQYNLSISVYLQMLPYLFFGKSVWVTRAVPALVSTGAALAVALILREIFRVRRAWVGVLLLAITPAWFLHSRTAFETSLMVSFYAGFLYTYLLYRFRSPRYLYAAVGLAALVFYSYSAGQAVIAITVLLLAVSDFRYHVRNRPTVLRAVGLGVLLALPYLRFLVQHPQENLRHLQVLNSYWTETIPLGEKLRRYLSEYWIGLSPGYWYFPNPRDLPRHVMDGFGHLLRPTLPFALLGLGIALRRTLRRTIRRMDSPAYRTVLIALLAAPAGAAIVQVGITRSLIFVIPAALLTALGISACLDWNPFKPNRVQTNGFATSRFAIGAWRRLPELAVFVLLAGTSLWLLAAALNRGPLWSRDYGMGGLQYGARQVFPAAQAYLEGHPGTKIILSPSWANGTDEVARFFLPDPLPIQLGTIDGHLMQRLPLDDQMLFIMIPEEYQRAAASGKFKDLQVEQTLPHPDGSPGFYFVRLRYVDDYDTRIAAEREQRRALQEASLVIDGQPAQVKHSMLDIGTIQEAFDGDPVTLVRSLEANPLVMEITFDVPQPLQGVTVRVGGVAARVEARVTAAGDAVPAGGEPPAGEHTYTRELGEDRLARNLSIRFPEPLEAARLRLEVTNVLDGDPAHVHVWEVWLEP
jgi:4-amino-4-deoxy-L-arabinose transferase-like glycosyltransferase